MTSAGGTPEGRETPPVDVTKPAADEPFDPYRFGKPDVPPPPQYAPPGYVPDDPAPAHQDQPGSQHPYAHGGYPPMPADQGPGPYGGYPPPYPGQYPPHQGYGMPPQGPPPYGMAPYGMAPYGPYPGARRSNGKAIAGMVLGIASIVLCWANFFTLVIIVPGIVFSLLGLGQAKARGGVGRGQAIAGLILVTVGIVLTVVISIVEFHLASSCSGIQQGTNAYKSCIRDSI